MSVGPIKMPNVSDNRCDQFVPGANVAGLRRRCRPAASDAGKSMSEKDVSEPSCPLPKQAYNLEMLHREGRPAPDSHGWCFGLPPGISPKQWPLDPLTGYPLVHGFTLRLPPDYRCRGPNIAGLSFFASCSEHSDGGTIPDEAIQSAITGSAAPDDARYLPFWTAAQDSHPRLTRMVDLLDDSFAVILLTEAELNGPLCRPPDTTAASALSLYRTPRWIAVGSGRDYFDGQSRSFAGGAEESFVRKMLGGIPDARLDWSRALRWSPRVNDPNAGKAPEDSFAMKKTSGYQQPYYFEGGDPKAANYRLHSWTADHARDHIGGTMQPIQATPRFSSFYIEFNEYLGGYNFGTGNCQLDILNMQLDWACG
jgi:hypothetical protein